MKCHKILNIIRFEIAQYLKSTTFLYTTILFPIFFVILLYINIERRKPIYLLVQNTTDISFSLDNCENIVPITIDKEQSINEAFAKNDNCQAVLKLSFVSDMQNLNATIYKKQKLPLGFYSTIRERILNAYADKLHGDSISIIRKEVENRFSLHQVFYTVNFDIKKDYKPANKYENLVITAIMVIYFIVFQFSNNIMKSISVEKQNRISEILLSSVHPKIIICGKIITGYILAIIQMVVWGIIIYMIVKTLFDLSILSSTSIQYAYSNSIPLLSMVELMLFLFIFIVCITGGYFMYASLFSIIGAISNANTDTQKFSFLLTMPLIITLVYVMEHLQNSNSVIVFLSYFPITSPIALMARLSSGINLYEIALSLLILVISMLVCIRLSSSLYRQGIIADTEKITIKTLIRWLRQ